MDKFCLQEKTAIVTGGAGGIGKACALAMAQAGANVAIVDIKHDEGVAVAEKIKAIGRDALYCDCDLSVLQNIQHTFRSIVEHFGHVDIAFNNAGISAPGGVPTLDDKALDIWDRIIAINLTSVFHCCREEGKYMALQKSGSIINTASMSASIVNRFPDFYFGSSMIAYCAAKAGVRQCTRALAIEWAKYNIRVNCISPGYVKTPLTAKLSNPRFAPVLEMQHETTPLRRRAEAEEMTGGVIYLASDASSYVTGADLVMDGGYSVW